MQLSRSSPRTSGTGSRRYIGTSGWQYADWRGVLYPKWFPQRRWLERYSETFDTVEVNNTSYGLPAVTTPEKWANTVPAGFVFALKTSRHVTHRKTLDNAAAPIHRFLERLSGIGTHLGPVVVQLPPSRPPMPRASRGSWLRFHLTCASQWSSVIPVGSRETSFVRPLSAMAPR